jgi:hypothetical protein
MPPILLTILKVIGPAGAVLLGLLAYNVLIDNPQVAREAALKERHHLTVKFMREAEEAAADERARQRQVIDDTVAAYEAALEAGEQARRAASEQQDQERADYEQKLRDAGRSDVVTDDDFDWLRRGYR